MGLTSKGTSMDSESSDMNSRLPLIFVEPVFLRNLSCLLGNSGDSSFSGLAVFI
jgi:hypothetical protein